MLHVLERYLVLALHIPDGFLSAPVSLLFWAVAVLCITIAVRRTSEALDDRQVPLMGVMAACIFAAQMLNFPVLGGTSGHLLGGALAAIVLGPWAAVLVMTCVIALQALLFQDGGLLVMGANIFNMGILTALVGGTTFYGLLRIFGRRSWGQVLAGFCAAWLSVIVSALFCSIQLTVSGTATAQVVLPAMIGVHLLIGVGEGLITVGAISFILTTRPDLLSTGLTDALNGKSRPLSRRGVLGTGLAIAVLLALLSPLASSSPDGLERVAEDQNFLDRALQPFYNLLPDYSIPGIANGALSTILAGLVGVIIVVALGYSVALLLRRRRELAPASGTKSATSSR